MNGGQGVRGEPEAPWLNSYYFFIRFFLPSCVILSLVCRFFVAADQANQINS